MNVVVFSKVYWPSVGGVESGSRILARSLARAGHAVTVFTATPHQGSELEEEYTIHRSRSFASFVRLSLKTDLIMVRGGVSAFAGLGGILALRPKIVIWHEMAGSYLHPGRRLRVRFSNLLRMQIVRRASAHVGLTKACLESKNLPSVVRSYVIPTPVDTGLIASLDEQGIENREVDVLFVGRFIAGKGIFTLAHALRELAAKGELLQVRFVGDGEDRKRLEAQTGGINGLTATFTGNQSGNALADSFRISRILVVPSTSHPEGQAIVIAEAMTFGLPVIVSDQAPMKETVGNAGIVVPSGDSGALAEAIQRLLRDQGLWKDLSEKARKRSAAFSVAHFEESLSGLIDGITQSR